MVFAVLAALGWGAWMIGEMCDGDGTELRRGGDRYILPDVQRQLLSDDLGAAEIPEVLDATPTPTPTPTPSPVPDVPEPTAPAEAGEPSIAPVPVEAEELPVVHPPSGWCGGREAVCDAFLAGYRAGGGDPAWEEHLIDVVQCESGWQLDPPGIHKGLAQFAPGTWEQARCSPTADYTDPWEQGCAVARWMAMIPGRWGTTAGWPYCWHVWN